MKVGFIDIDGEVCDVFLIEGEECIEGGYIEGDNGELIPVWMPVNWEE